MPSPNFAEPCYLQQAAHHSFLTVVAPRLPNYIVYISTPDEMKQKPVLWTTLQKAGTLDTCSTYFFLSKSRSHRLGHSKCWHVLAWGWYGYIEMVLLIQFSLALLSFVHSWNAATFNLDFGNLTYFGVFNLLLYWYFCIRMTTGAFYPSFLLMSLSSWYFSINNILPPKISFQTYLLYFLEGLL